MDDGIVDGKTNLEISWIKIHNFENKDANDYYEFSVPCHYSVEKIVLFKDQNGLPCNAIIYHNLNKPTEYINLKTVFSVTYRN